MKHELSDIDPQKMDSQKWDLLLDLLEHPEKYSETQKDELLGDEEVNELYQQLVETRQSLDFGKSKEEMKMPGNRSQDILKLSVFVNQWELGKTCRICLFFYVGFLRSRNLLDRSLMG